MKLWSAMCIVSRLNRLMAWRKCAQSLQNKNLDADMPNCLSVSDKKKNTQGSCHSSPLYNQADCYVQEYLPNQMHWATKED